jgi:toxin secretion/phage lysis holin
MDWSGVKVALGAAGAAIAGLWGGLEMAVQVLLILMGVDVATGMLAAWRERTLSSRFGWRGITIRKATTLLVVAMASAAEPLLGGIDAGTFAAGFYCATEALSVIENAARAGVPVPVFLTRALAQLKTQAGGEAAETKEVAHG